MSAKIELTDEAERLLMGAEQGGAGLDGKPLWFIDRRLGFKTWESKGKAGTRPDVAELYRHGLIAEWFSPLSPPLFLTATGKEQKELRGAQQVSE